MIERNFERLRHQLISFVQLAGQELNTKSKYFMKQFFFAELFVSDI